jgi:hypothetical protein
MISRRNFLTVGAPLVLVPFAAGCKAAEFTCTDLAGVPAADAQTRTTLGYVDRATDQSKVCLKCVQYVEPTSEGQCGGCKVLKGPIHPLGGCNAFSAKT